MIEIRSPLSSSVEPGEYGAQSAAKAALQLSERAPGSLIQIAGWQDFATVTAPALGALGFDGHGNFRTVQTAGPVSCYRIAPDKLLLRHSDGGSFKELLENLNPASSPTLDLSHARWLIEIEGSEVEALLARLASLDFSLQEFREGTFAQTGIHHVGVLLHRVSADKFLIFVPVTWAESIWNLICETAAPFGFKVIVHP